MPSRFLIAVLFSLSATHGLAEDKENYSWCRGFIIKALAAFPIAGLSRNYLWLDWNESVQQTIVTGRFDEASYQAGRDHIERMFEANDVPGIIETSEEVCDIGRNRTWFWW